MGEEPASRPGVQCCPSRTERLGLFSQALKEAGKGRKNKPRHTLGGCWLAQPLGTLSPCNARQWDPASPSKESTPGWAGLSWLLSSTIASWDYKKWILTEFGGVQYFSRKMGILDQEVVHCACVDTSLPTSGVAGPYLSVLGRVTFDTRPQCQTKKSLRNVKQACRNLAEL